MLQTLIILALVALAALYLGRRAVASLRRVRQAAGGSAGCGTDCGCGPGGGKSRE